MGTALAVPYKFPIFVITRGRQPPRNLLSRLFQERLIT